MGMNGLSKSGRVVYLTTILLTLVGIWMVYSASKTWSNYLYGDASYYVKKQIIFAIIGLGLLWFCSRIKMKFLYRYATYFLIVVLLLLIVVLIPGIGIVRGGSQSWFGIGEIAFQPAEMFKLAVIIWCAKQLADHYNDSKYFLRNVIPILLPALIGFVLIMLQPDFGTGIVMFCAVIVMTMVSRASFQNYIRLGLLGVFGIIAMIVTEPYRLERITAFIDPWADPLGSGFQIIQSLYAIGPGGLLGLGIDGSIQKHYFLPEPQTDFIFAILAEEMGLIGGLLIIALFAILIYHSFQIALRSTNHFASFLAVGITALVGIQVAINLGVVVGLLPVTGITLPFISYGGSSLVIMLASQGILCSLDRNREEVI